MSSSSWQGMQHSRAAEVYTHHPFLIWGNYVKMEVSHTHDNQSLLPKS